MASDLADPHTQALASQVGGHAGVMVTEDGSLLIKPALPTELEFYQAIQQDPKLALLREYTPKFLGMLRLEGEVSDIGLGKLGEGGGLGDDKQKDKYPLSLVLENLSHTFLKPNILDIKLGTVLHGPGSSPEKVERMKKVAAETTSLETGVRLTGFQVYDNTTGLAVNTPKSYGKSIKPRELGEGVAKFFAVGDSSTSGLPKKTLVPILQRIREEVEEIRNIFAELEVRMVGGSLLVIYEADWQKAEEKLNQDEDDDEDDDDDEDESKPGPPFVVRVIDFAHTTHEPGQGVDSGVLLGLNTVLRLLDERLSGIN